jgi:P-type Cu2+ transporter
MQDWSAYDDPALRDSVSPLRADGTREALIAVDGVHCSACVRGVERSLAGVADDVQVDLASRTLTFRFEPSKTTLAALLQKLDGAGYTPQVLAQDGAWHQQLRERRAALARVGVAVLCAMQVMMFAWPEYFDGEEIDTGIRELLRWAQWLVATPAVFYSGWPFIQSAWRALRVRTLVMDVPVAASILVAYFASAWRTASGSGELYFDAATMFVLLLGAGRYLEGRTRALAGERLRRLAGRQSLDAARIDGDSVLRVPVSTLRAGDHVRVAPGEALPADGCLLGDAADLDESLLTGESRPVHRRAGEKLLGGSVNLGAQPIDLRVTATGAATRLAAITRLLQQARTDKPRLQLAADRIAKHFVAVVLLLAIGGAAWWWPSDPELALQVFLAVLVASCPCALSLATPAVFAAASARLAAAGVLLAHPSVLARLPRITHVLFDKTGTLTETRLQLVRVEALGAVPADHCTAIAAALERDLRHPIAQALVAATAETLHAEGVRLMTGGGVSGRVERVEYALGALGSEARAGHRAFDETSALVWVALTRGPQTLALFGMAARARDDAAQAVTALQDDGIAVSVLTGDSEATAWHLAGAVGIAEVHARQTPEQKLAVLRSLQQRGGVVMAVGDGINDAPLLAAADVAVAMPGGAALAQARADVILTGDSLAALATLRAIARRARRRIHENFGWALGYNLLMLPFALSGALTPWLAALGMSLSSLVVVVNALRLGDERDSREVPNGGAALPAAT